MRLVSKRTNQTLVPNLEVANSLWSRMRGLLGRTELPSDRALYIPRCGSVHTFFMNFPIDLVFVNDRMEVTKLVKHVGPGRLVFAGLRARHVIELSAGFLDINPIQLGEQLHVDHTIS